jgi:hypothetical protein
MTIVLMTNPIFNLCVIQQTLSFDGLDQLHKAAGLCEINNIDNNFGGEDTSDYILNIARC